MLVLPAALTAVDAVATQRMLAEALQRETGPDVVVDASGLQQFDSATLAVLLACHRLTRAAGKRFSVQALPPKLQSLAGLYGIDGLMKAQ